MQQRWSLGLHAWLASLLAVTGGHDVPDPRRSGKWRPSSAAPSTLGWSVADADRDGTSTATTAARTIPTKIAPGQCGCGVPDTDTDGERHGRLPRRLPNDPLKIRAGACGCGIATPTGRRRTPNCFDGAERSVEGRSGIAARGVADTDSDGDGTANCFDGCRTIR